MKKCSYCGAEYPDDETECAIDMTPFANASSDAPPGLELPKFAVFSEHKIPASLAVLSYIYFLPAALCFAYLAFFMCLLVYSGSAGSILDGPTILGCITCTAIGFF